MTSRCQLAAAEGRHGAAMELRPAWASLAGQTLGELTSTPYSRLETLQRKCIRCVHVRHSWATLLMLRGGSPWHLDSADRRCSSLFRTICTSTSLYTDDHQQSSFDFGIRASHRLIDVSREPPRKAGRVMEHAAHLPRFARGRAGVGPLGAQPVWLVLKQSGGLRVYSRFG
jgi:hypothetical protein